jgi:type III secretion protein R
VVNIASYNILTSGVVILLLTTSFIKIFTTLTLLRFGIGINQWEGGVIVVILSMALTLFVMDANQTLWTYSDDLSVLKEKTAPFLRLHTDALVYDRLSALRKKSTVNDEVVVEKLPEHVDSDPSLDNQQSINATTTDSHSVNDDYGFLVASFAISQLRDAFEIGFIILVPFLIVDLLIINILMLLGAQAVAVEMIAVPIKILLFFSVDGWTLIGEKLLREFM